MYFFPVEFAGNSRMRGKYRKKIQERHVTCQHTKINEQTKSH